eukprot:gene4024-7280_t
MNALTKYEVQVLKKYYPEYHLSDMADFKNVGKGRYNTAATIMHSLNLTLMDEQKSRNWSVAEVQQFLKGITPNSSFK